jgi:hypothetical protein
MLDAILTQESVISLAILVVSIQVCGACVLDNVPDRRLWLLVLQARWTCIGVLLCVPATSTWDCKTVASATVAIPTVPTVLVLAASE